MKKKCLQDLQAVVDSFLGAGGLTIFLNESSETIQVELVRTEVVERKETKLVSIAQGTMGAADSFFSGEENDTRAREKTLSVSVLLNGVITTLHIPESAVIHVDNQSGLLDVTHGERTLFNFRKS